MICAEGSKGQDEEAALNVLYNFRYFLYTFRRNKLLSYLQEKGVRKELAVALLKEFRNCALDMPIMFHFTENTEDMEYNFSDFSFSKDLGYFFVKSININALKSKLPPHLANMAKPIFFFILSHEVVHVIDLCTLHTLGTLIEKDNYNSYADSIGLLNEEENYSGILLHKIISDVLEMLSELTPIYLKKFFDANNITMDMRLLARALDIFVQYHEAVHEIIKIKEKSHLMVPINTEHLLQWYDGTFDHFEKYFITLALPSSTLTFPNCIEKMTEDVSIILENVNLKRPVPKNINDIITMCKSAVHNVGIYTWCWEIDPKNPWSSSLGVPLLVRVRQRVAPTSITFLVFLIEPREPAPITSFTRRVGELVSALKLHIPYVSTIVLFDERMQYHLLLEYGNLLDYYSQNMTGKAIWESVLRNVLKTFPTPVRVVKVGRKVSVRSSLVFFAVSSWSEKVEKLIKGMISRDKPSLAVFVMPTSSRLPPSKFLRKMGAYLVLLGRDETSDVILTPDYLELMEKEFTYRSLYRLSLSVSSPHT